MAINEIQVTEASIKLLKAKETFFRTIINQTLERLDTVTEERYRLEGFLSSKKVIET